MPNIKSSKKRVKVLAVKHLQNKSLVSQLRTQIKKADLALSENAEDKNEVVRIAIKKIDQAASKGVLHKNAAAHKKSALDKRLHAGS